MAGRLTLEKIFMTEASRRDYVDQLWNRPLAGDSESGRIYKWMSDHVEVPTRNQSVVQAVRKWMALEVTDG